MLLELFQFTTATVNPELIAISKEPVIIIRRQCQNCKPLSREKLQSSTNLVVATTAKNGGYSSNQEPSKPPQRGPRRDDRQPKK